jgi:RNA polymerase sigma-70 factor (ECF subfamily)
LAKGNDARWQETCADIVRSHYVAVYQLLFHLTRDSCLADDLTQETFISAWQHLAEFQGRSSMRTWLHRIAYRKYVDGLRQCKKVPAFCRLQAATATPSGELGPLDRLLAAEQCQRLYEAVQALTDDRERTVVILRYFQDLSFREIASLVGEPTGTLKWRAQCALGRLRHQLSWESDYDD